MSAYRIVCTTKEPSPSGRHEHIATVGVGDQANQASNMLAVAKVIQMIDAGDTFHTEAAGRRARVEKMFCPQCDPPRYVIRTHRDDVLIDNLDAIRACRAS